MSWTVHPSTASRHLLLRASAGEVLPEALIERLSAEAVACGWLHASGVLHDVELRAFDAELGTLGRARRIAGPVQILSLESSIALSDGEPHVTLRALLARETDRGLETLAGEITSAKTVALEVFVTALDDVALGRALDPAAGVWLLGAGASSGAPRAATSHAAPAAAAPPAWSSALAASDRPVPEPARKPPAPTSSPSLPGSTMPLPQRPVRKELDLDAPHARGRRRRRALRVRPLRGREERRRPHPPAGRQGGRIREIALEMLRVSRLDDTAEGKRRFRLERRM